MTDFKKYNLLLDYFISNGDFHTDRSGHLLFDCDGTLIDPTLTELEEMLLDDGVKLDELKDLWEVNNDY